MTRSIGFCLTVAFLVGLAASAGADDFWPAPWRGGELSVYAEWEFIGDFTPDPMNIYPDSFSTVGDGIHDFYGPGTHAHTSPEVYWEVDPSDPADGRAYTDSLAGTIDFFLTNWIDDYIYKYVWVQITYGGAGIPFVYEVVAPNQVTNEWTDPVYGDLVEVYDHAPGQRVEHWVIPYNPDREHVYVEIPPYTWIDQTIIETISTMVPTSTERSTWGSIKSMYK